MTAKTKKKKAKVFLAPGNETQSGYHEVIYSKTGNLNTGKKKRFLVYQEAVDFAIDKGQSLNAEVTIPRYMKYKKQSFDFSTYKRPVRI